MVYHMPPPHSLLLSSFCKGLERKEINIRNINYFRPQLTHQLTSHQHYTGIGSVITPRLCIPPAYLADFIHFSSSISSEILFRTLSTSLTTVSTAFICEKETHLGHMHTDTHAYLLFIGVNSAVFVQHQLVVMRVARLVWICTHPSEHDTESNIPDRASCEEEGHQGLGKSLDNLQMPLPIGEC